MATFATSTPSPPPSIRTPPTPRHGYSDSWEPYAPRKSARLSAQRSSHRTPSPQASHRHRTPPRTIKKSAVAAPSSIMSPAATPQKRHLPALDLHGRGASSFKSGNAAHNNDKAKMGEASCTTAITRRTGMLPTPVKTPKQPPTEAQTASIRAVARNLFVHDESGLDGRKKRLPKKYSGISMESFIAEEEAEPIAIFTDTRDRVPKVDRSAENPFYAANAATAPEPPRRRSKRKVAVPGEGAQNVDEALQREDGMVYVFRGKKIFRKFAQNDEDAEEANDASSHLHIPLTRSSIKPRRLFQPRQPEIEVTPEDEEAVTDIEDNHMSEVDTDIEQKPETPAEEKSCPNTPSAPRFGPVATPPDTRRITRFGAKFEEATPSKGKNGMYLSDDSRATKSRSSSVERGTKRAAEQTLSPSTRKRARA